MTPPEPSSISIKVEVLNSIVMLRPSPSSKDGLKLSLPNVLVTNSTVVSKEYGAESVLLEDYNIKIQQVVILRQLKEITN